jgi:hypothetical protein
MKIILFPIVYLFELIKANIVKTIMVTITSILFAYAGTIPDQTYERVILKEIKIGNDIIEKYTTGQFGTLLLTNTVKEYYSDDINNKLLNEIQPYTDLTFFYYGSKSISDTVFNKIKHINLINI